MEGLKPSKLASPAFQVLLTQSLNDEALAPLLRPLADVVDRIDSRVAGLDKELILHGGIGGALARHAKPEIFNTDQGSQFTILSFTQVLMDAGIRISIDGRGRWMDCEYTNVVRAA